MDDEPDWIKQAKGMNITEPQEPVQPLVAPPAETPPEEQTPTSAVPPAPVNTDELGKSEQEIDDALAWFEGLAAKQGATEGLLTRPEERMEKEPDWVQKIKNAGNALPSATPPPPPVMEDLTPEPVAPESGCRDTHSSAARRSKYKYRRV